MDSRTIARFNAKVDRDGPVPAHCPELGPCWLWTAHCDYEGYGRFWHNRQMITAQRVALEIAIGPIPAGLHALHRCDNPPCVRGSHIVAGTIAENMADRDRKGRHRALKGRDNGNSKLGAAQVLQIRAAHARGGVTYRELGKRFGIHTHSVGPIVLRKTWAWLEPPR